MGLGTLKEATASTHVLGFSEEFGPKSRVAEPLTRTGEVSRRPVNRHARPHNFTSPLDGLFL